MEIKKYLILLFLFAVDTSHASTTCEETIFNKFIQYKKALASNQSQPDIYRYFSIQSYRDHAKLHLKHNNITGLLFVSDKQLTEKAHEFILNFNEVFAGIKGIYSYLAFC